MAIMYNAIIEDKPALQDLYLAHYGVKGMKWGVRKTVELLGRGRKSISKIAKNETVKKTLAKATAYSNNVGSGLALVGLASGGARIASNHLKGKAKDRATKALDTVDRSAAKINHLPLPDISGTSSYVAAGMQAFKILSSNPLSAGPTAIATAGYSGFLAANRIRHAGLSIYRLPKYLKERNEAQIDQETGLRLKSKESSMKEDIRRVNPSYGDLRKGTKNNCVACSLAYDLRRRGYDVQAKTLNYGDSELKIGRYYKNAKPKIVPQPITKAYKELMSEPDGARGQLTIQWISGGGHAMAYEKQNGKVYFIDPQSGWRYNGITFIPRSALSMGLIKHVRLDNLEPNFEALKEDYVK